ncbi:response regulator transcription factor [Traorella massiliensis]|mgnify:FL=1|uniref:response regulator transcription factor n=1 Tax=Traorella massiliensis TaxID=1903263 RepID=UPI00248DFD9A|nr:response regulator transcription factor [Traorella massiliensis]
MATIYIVEDDLNIREIETFALKNSGYSVVDFECAKDFYKKLDEKVPNLIILDIMLPDEDGLSIVQRLRKKADTKNVPVLLISAKTSEIDVVKGLDMGADDYLTKPFGVMELISRVKALLRRSSYSENEKVLSLREILMDDEKRSVYVNDEAIELTFKEYELLKLLLINSGIVLTREKLMEKVWGTDFEGESRTLDMHIKTLRQKLKSAGSYIKTVRNVGYMLE